MKDGAEQSEKRRPQRQCNHTMETGERCRRVPSPGEQYCHCHLQFRGRGAERPIRVPLLEDPASIRFVVSEVCLAMAFGTLPPANANAMLRGCQTAMQLLEMERQMAQVEKDPVKKERRKSAGDGRDEDEEQEEERGEAAEVAPAQEDAGEAAGACVEEEETAAAAGAGGEIEVPAMSGEGEPWRPETSSPAQSRETPRLGDLRGDWEREMLRVERQVERGFAPHRNWSGVMGHPDPGLATPMVGERDWEGEERAGGV